MTYVYLVIISLIVMLFVVMAAQTVIDELKRRGLWLK